MSRNHPAGNLRFLVIGHFGCKNVGDDAMLVGILKGLYAYFVNPRIRVLSTSRRAVSCYNFPEEEVQFLARSWTSTLRSLAWAHVILLGGGTHFHDFRGHRRYAKNLVFFGVFFILARLLRKEVAFVGIGVGPLDTWWGKWLTRFTFSLADLVIVREHRSFQLAKKLILEKNSLVLGFDPAALLFDSLDKTNNRTSASPRILGCSILPYYAIYENRPQRDGELVRTLAKAIRYWLGEDKNREAHILVFRGASKEDDFKISRRLANEISRPARVSIVPYEPDPRRMLQETEKCDVLIAMRFHSIVFSYLSQRPCIVLSYHPKCEAIASEIEIPLDAVLSLDEASNADLMMRKLRYMTNHPEEFLARLPINESLKRIREMYAELEKLLGRGKR